jgi:iron complex outermembrane receptor protein
MNRTTFTSIVLALPLLGVSPLTVAQEESVLEEIVVTATKRETNLMDTPVIVSAFSQQTLDRKGIQDGRDLGELVPNLFVSLDQSQNQVEFTLRGVGSTMLEQISDPTVGLHVDGVYQPRPQGAMALMYDLERLEVLRGPQGTLFGRNSTVGTVNIIPAKPQMDELGGSVDLDIGDYNKRQVRTMINAPITDTLAFRANYMVDSRDSYIFQDFDAVSPDQRRNLPRVGRSDWYFNNDQEAFRLSALWEPIDDFSWLVSYEQFKDKGAGATRLRNCRDFDCSNSGGTPDRPAATLRPTGSSDVFYNNVDTIGQLDIDQESIRSIVTYDFRDWFQVKYTFGYTSQDRSQVADDDAGWGFDGLQQVLETVISKNESTSHEVQVQSTGDGPFQWIAGYWAFEEDNSLRLDIDLQFIPGAVILLWPENKVDADAFYFEGNYALNDQWTITAGVRQTNDSKDQVQYTFLGFGDEQYLNNEPTFSFTNGTFGFTSLDGVTGEFGNFFEAARTPLTKESDKTTWKLGVDWRFDADSLLFATLATGFKAAPFDSALTDPSTGETRIVEVEPEEITNLEFGYKVGLLDNRLNLTANVFFSEYENLQRTSLVKVGEDPILGDDIFSLLTINAAEATINGVEIEADWLVGDNGRLSGWVTWLDATFDDFPNQQDAFFCAERFPDNPPVNGSQCPIENLAGNTLAKAPEWSFTVSYEHTFELPNGGSVVPWINVHWEDDYFLRDQNVTEAPYRDAQDSWATVDLNLRYNSPEGNWYAELYGTNITDELVATRIDQFGGSVTNNYNEPRMWGGRFGFIF